MKILCRKLVVEVIMEIKRINIEFNNQYEGNQEDVCEKEFLETSYKIANFFLSKQDLLAQSALSNFTFDKISFELIWVDNEEIRSINKEYRKKDCPTDVITFALYNDSEDKILVENEIHLGQIIIKTLLIIILHFLHFVNSVA